jgi:hypothetical protein
VTAFFAPSSLPQMNIVGFPPLNRGLTMRTADRVEGFDEFAAGMRAAAVP